MQILFYGMAACIFSIDWFADKLLLLPHGATYYAEGYAMLFMLTVALVLSRRRKMDVDPKIAIIVFFIILSFLASTITNNVSMGVLMGGIRIHLKFLPFLILPLVYPFSDEQIRRQLIFVLALTLLQTPVVFYQRFVKYASTISGDPIGGTLGANSSGILSIWLACIITVVFSFYLVNKMRPWTAIVLLLVLITPMTLNETKISFFLIPLALIVPAFFSSRGTARIVRIATTLAVTFTFFVLLIVIYNTLQPNRDILEWFATDSTEYVYKGSTTGGERANVKRLDAIRIAYTKLQYENSLVFGLGPGNLSPAFSRNFEGKYFRRYENFQPKKVQISLSLWETGVVGISLMIALMLGCGNIGNKLATENHGDQYQALALGWTGVTAILLFCLFYLTALTINLFVIYYWFYSGVIIARYVSTRSNEHRPGFSPEIADA